jgi:Concanavalin A-like lectin/glucanases superfamily
MRMARFVGGRFRSQSAMEYLMTYGWAILIISVVLGVLFSEGIFSSANIGPRAQAGSCRIYRVAGAANLEGTCSGILPQYVAQFSGQGSYISVGNAANNLASQVTVSGWIYVSVLTPHKNYVFSNDRDSSGSYKGFSLRAENGAGLFLIWDTSSLSHSFSGGTINTNNWYFLTGTFDGNYLTLYINGQYVGRTAYSGQIGTPASFTSELGGMGYNTNLYTLSGMLSNVQVYNASLDANQISALYTEGIGGAPIDPNHVVGWWPLNGNANDYSGNNNGGTATNIIYTGLWTQGYTVS